MSASIEQFFGTYTPPANKNISIVKTDNKLSYTEMRNDIENIYFQLLSASEYNFPLNFYAPTNDKRYIALRINPGQDIVITKQTDYNSLINSLESIQKSMLLANDENNNLKIRISDVSIKYDNLIKKNKTLKICLTIVIIIFIIYLLFGKKIINFIHQKTV